MEPAGAILGLHGVRSSKPFGAAIGAIDLALEPGDLALIDARDATLAGALADLCCGLITPVDGEVRFLQRDWTRQPRQVADALRGLIGRVFANPGWLGFLDAETNILFQQLHHTRSNIDVLREEAIRLAIHFGLPGLPGGPIARFSRLDLVRAGLVRAFLGSPRLVILESPVQGEHLDVVAPLINKIAEVRDRGGAAMWLTRSRMVWENARFPATIRMRMDHQGLAVLGAAA